nr:hypothetical protein [Candidatus Sigynarchaeota archaeon]
MNPTPSDKGWDLAIIDEKHNDCVRTRVFVIDKKARSKRILVETKDAYEHIDACMNPTGTRIIVLKAIDIPENDERNEYIEIYDPSNVKLVLSMSNWPVNNVVFSPDGNFMYLQAKLETGTPIEVVLNTITGEKVEGASRQHAGKAFVNIADLLKQRKRTTHTVV